MPKKDWYSPGAIRFTRRQMLWLIANLGTLEAGHYPPEISNYFDQKLFQKTKGNKAPFIIPIEIAAEVNTRLEACGADGLSLLASQGWGMSDASIARYFHTTEKRARKRYKTALAYITGRCRRWQDCPGHDKCSCCKNCQQYNYCVKKPRLGKSYNEFKKNKRSK